MSWRGGTDATSGSRSSALWLNRRAEGVWVTGDSLDQFTCRSHCIIQNPNGPGVWRIWRVFQRTDIVRFRLHYRVWWAGHLNPVVDHLAPALGDPDPNNINNRFCLAMDHMEVTLPMEPADPDPLTPGINEGVMIMDENGLPHFLGEPGFEQMPDTAANPNGFQLATTAQSTDLLPPAPERIIDPPMTPGPGKVEISPGVVVEWLMDDNGAVLVDNDGVPGPDDPASPTVLGAQKHQGLIGVPTGVDGNELALDQGNRELQLYCWALDENGEVLGALPGQTVIGPPVDADGDGLVDNAEGAPIPMDPTVRDDTDAIIGATPGQFLIEEEGPPDPVELAALNQQLIDQGLAPLVAPFRLCIYSIKTLGFWGVDRRVVMDLWLHHWTWLVANHISLTAYGERIWISKLAISAFSSEHHHHVYGQPPVWTSFTLVDVRFFQVCYRIHCPGPARLRLTMDEVWIVVPLNPSDPNSDLMLLTTENNENELLPPGVLAGFDPGSLPFDANGVYVEPLIDPQAPFNPADTAAFLDLGGGGTGQFDGDLQPLADNVGAMLDIPVIASQDFDNALNNNQLQLYCWVLDANGNPKQETFDLSGTCPCDADLNDDGQIDAGDLAQLLGFFGCPVGVGDPLCDAADINCDGVVDMQDEQALLCQIGGPGDPACCSGGARVRENPVMGAPSRGEPIGTVPVGLPPPDVTLTMGPTPAIPLFDDGMGGFMPDPTMLGLNMMATPPICPADLDGDEDVDVFDFARFAPNFGKKVPFGTFGDLNADGFIDVFDFALFAPNFGCPP